MSINACVQCLEKQRQIDRLESEVQRLKAALRYKERKEKDGFFGSSTSSAKLPAKPNVPDRPKKKRGGKRGHKGAGRKGFDAEHADRVERLPPPDLDKCPCCGAELEEGEEETRGVGRQLPRLVKASERGTGAAADGGALLRNPRRDADRAPGRCLREQ